MSDSKTIAVIGAGIGGFFAVAYLGAAGHKMRLHDIDAIDIRRVFLEGTI